MSSTPYVASKSQDGTAAQWAPVGRVERIREGYRELCVSCDPAFVELRVERVNPGAPLQQRLLCRMNSCWPSGFSPCHDEDFQPIAGHLPLMVT
ncbi:MAG TPA: hypothetical protein VIM11_24520 [Tepidisphaeraceae bacterium]|jgi:hypothetical protein